VSQTDDPIDEPPEQQRSLLDRLRTPGVGMEDPNIIGDAGPTDVAPGHDPDLPILTEELPPEEETPAEQALPSDESIPGVAVPVAVAGEVPVAAAGGVPVAGEVPVAAAGDVGNAIIVEVVEVVTVDLPEEPGE
jgi:hypothetical protein